jgi:hypothetical protein
MEQQIQQQRKVQATVSVFPILEVDVLPPYQRLHQGGAQAFIRKRIQSAGAGAVLPMQTQPQIREAAAKVPAEIRLERLVQQVL